MVEYWGETANTSVILENDSETSKETMMKYLKQPRIQQIPNGMTLNQTQNLRANRYHDHKVRTRSTSSKPYGLDWIGLDLFNDDTRPSGHISRPTQVNVSELLLLFKQLLKSDHIVHFGG